MNILEQITTSRRKEIQLLPEDLSTYEGHPNFELPRVSLKHALLQSELGVIAEFKRRSPSKGALGTGRKLVDVVATYQSLGATALSILTEPSHFAGSTLDLELARDTAPTLPILQKDFILSEKQILQSRAIGADCILLIAGILSPEEIVSLSKFAKSLELEVLLEVHSLEELHRSITQTVDIIGVNNRDLTTFSTDLNRSVELIHEIPGEFVPISESGIRCFADMTRLKSLGYKGFLIGETLMNGATQISSLTELGNV
jgi:indole-3-glycerol phosphate synthase